MYYSHSETYHLCTAVKSFKYNMPPRKKVPSLWTLSMNAVGQIVKNTCITISSSSFNQQEQGDHTVSYNASKMMDFDWVDNQVSLLQELLFSSVPHYSFESLVQTLISVLTEAALNSRAMYRKVMFSTPESIHDIKVILRFLKLIVHPKVRSLDLSTMPKVLRDSLYRSLSEFSGLVNLNLGSGTLEAGRRRISMTFKHLPHLQSITYTVDCQNDTLAVIGQNCPNLMHLDISSSSSVTDQGATWLLRCKNLKNLNLYQTLISEEGYAQLLLGLPCLESIGRCDSFGQVLEYLVVHNHQPVELSMTNFHSRDMSHEQLKLLVLMCPKLRIINLYVDEDMGNLLEPLKRLEYLEELTLLACNFYSDGINELLHEKGRSLKMLHLEHVDELNMNALCCIAENCVNLNRLVFFSCDFVENFGASHVDRRFTVKPFLHLNHLICVSETAPNILEFLLIHASELRTIKFGSTAWFNDETVENVVNKGALRNVEEIKILRSYELTIKSVELLMKVCPNLRVLAEMDGWEAISEIELLRLRHKLKTENYDLDTFSSWITPE